MNILFANNIKIALRNQKKNKFFSLINITSLALGLACCMAITIYVIQELSFDKYHIDSDNTYVIGIDEKLGDQQDTYYSTQAPIGRTLKSVFPSVNNYTRIITFRSNMIVKANNQKVIIENIFPTDSTFFDVFSVQFINGNKDALRSKNSIVLTRTIAEKLFNSCENAMGKIIEVYNSNLIIRAVVEDCPYNTHFTFSALYPMENETWVNDNRWDGFPMHTYIRLEPNTNYKDIEKKTNELIQQSLGEDFEIYKEPNHFKYFFTPITNIHLRTSIGQGSIVYIKIISLIAIFILIIGCINFANLSTAKASKRACEVGIKKALGSSRIKLIYQFFTESVVTSLIAFVFALVILELSLPYINSLMGLQLQTILYSNYKIFIIFIGIAAITGLIAGAYSAIYLSSFNTTRILKKEITNGKNNSKFRGSLVILQFSISIFLIISTLLINKQLNYISEKDLGYRKENLIKINEADAIKNHKAFTQELMNIPAIKNISFATALPGDAIDGKVFYNTNKDDKKEYALRVIACDDQYAKTMKYQLIKGRFLSNNFASDSSAIVLNETAIKTMGITNPLESKIRYWNKEFSIVGVVKDFHLSSFNNKIEPVSIILYKKWYQKFERVAIRLENYYPKSSINKIKNIWDKFSNNAPMDLSYMENNIERMHEKEHKQLNTFTCFSLLAMFIACIGLLGLVSFTVEQKVKEIGIRKVYGAPISSLLLKMNTSIIKWMLISFIIASPATYYFMNNWLDGFAYKIDIGVSEFLLTGLATLVITLTTVSWQIIRAAKKNPIDAIKYE